MATKIRIIPNTRTVRAGIKESDSYFLCPTNTVMTGRYHKDDENGQTQYEYATLKAVDEKGNTVSGTITVDDVKWDTAVKESSSNYNAPSNRVIVGRQHADDENGQTKYATAVVKYNGQATFIEEIIMSDPIKESAGIWFRTDSNHVITGRRHSGDENRPTTYYSGIITTNFNPEQGIKIIVALHPNEKFYPMDPIQFIKESRFRRHRSSGKDDGYSKVVGDFVEKSNSKDPEFYDIPVSVINSFNTGDIHTNLRPRDDHSIGINEVFLQPDIHCPGDSNPTGRVPVFIYSSNCVVNGQTRERREYWLFYGYDDVDTGLIQLSHQGDWERITIDIYNNKIVEVRLDQHGKSKVYSTSQVELAESNGVQILKVYSARGAHATYEKVGDFDRAGVAKDHTGNGYQWEITKKVENLTDQPWKLYAGAWGEVGQHPSSTGPLGPWYKRMDIK